jgi:hypothetical protein
MLNARVDVEIPSDLEWRRFRLMRVDHRGEVDATAISKLTSVGLNGRAEAISRCAPPNLP